MNKSNYRWLLLFSFLYAFIFGVLMFMLGTMYLGLPLIMVGFMVVTIGLLVFGGLLSAGLNFFKVLSILSAGTRAIPEPK